MRQAHRRAYIALYETGRLDTIADELESRMHNCLLCPFNCSVDRFSGERGICDGGYLPQLASWGAHFGEEAPLIGSNGSGTIFFTGCNLSCIFCQNYDISQLGNGKIYSFSELASIMLKLQRQGCHNINFVSPSHMIYPIIMALKIAIPEGLNIPLVYNSGGYDSRETLRIIEGVFDIYMPDFKYAGDDIGMELSRAPDYASRAREALSEMHRQLGDLRLNNRGLAVRGLIVRHLVLPEDLAGSYAVLDFIRTLSENTYLNIMAQYRPAYHAARHPCLGRRIREEEYQKVKSYAKKIGLKRLAR